MYMSTSSLWYKVSDIYWTKAFDLDRKLSWPSITVAAPPSVLWASISAWWTVFFTPRFSFPFLSFPFPSYFQWSERPPTSGRIMWFSWHLIGPAWAGGRAPPAWINVCSVGLSPPLPRHPLWWRSLPYLQQPILPSPPSLPSPSAETVPLPAYIPLVLAVLNPTLCLLPHDGNPMAE